MANGSVLLRDLAGQIRDIPDRAMIPVLKAVKKLAADEGGTMSRVGRRGAKLKAVDERRDQSLTTLVVWRIQGVPVGPWVWATSGTKPHAIRRRKRGPLRKMTVPHPGTAGRGSWDRVVARAEQIVPAAFADTLDDVLRGW